jgi:hypothetical protein
MHRDLNRLPQEVSELTARVALMKKATDTKRGSLIAFEFWGPNRN